METTTYTTGNTILRRVLQAQWETIDAILVDQHRQAFPPAVVHADGHDPVTVVSRFGRLTLSRQVCQHADTQTHIMPGNADLPSKSSSSKIFNGRSRSLQVAITLLLCLGHHNPTLFIPTHCNPISQGV